MSKEAIPALIYLLRSCLEQLKKLHTEIEKIETNAETTSKFPTSDSLATNLSLKDQFLLIWATSHTCARTLCRLTFFPACRSTIATEGGIGVIVELMLKYSTPPLGHYSNEESAIDSNNVCVTQASDVDPLEDLEVISSLLFMALRASNAMRIVESGGASLLAQIVSRKIFPIIPLDCLKDGVANMSQCPNDESILLGNFTNQQNQVTELSEDFLVCIRISMIIHALSLVVDTREILVNQGIMCTCLMLCAIPKYLSDESITLPHGHSENDLVRESTNQRHLVDSLLDSSQDNTMPRNTLIASQRAGLIRPPNRDSIRACCDGSPSDIDAMFATRHHCIRAMTSLCLVESIDVRKLIIKQGIVEALVALTPSPITTSDTAQDHRLWISVALYFLAYPTETRIEMVKQGSVAALSALVSVPPPSDPSGMSNSGQPRRQRVLPKRASAMMINSTSLTSTNSSPLIK